VRGTRKPLCEASRLSFWTSMRATGQKATLQDDRHMSALLQKADITDFQARQRTRSGTISDGFTV
jgi:hypothetical protein